MARTRSARLQESKLPEVTDHQDDENNTGENEDAPEHSVGRDAPVAFKTALNRFRHDEVADGSQIESSDASEAGNRVSGHEDYRNGRKRPLEAAIKQEQPVSTTSPSPAKRRRQPSKYAPPSKYAHLPTLVDILEPNLICVFVGTNPGIRTATAGHAYAHPSNLFWKLLHWSKCTDEKLKPEQDVDLPRLYSMGNTNIVERPSKDAAELSKAEMTEGTSILEEKFRKHRPEAVCIVGKGIWEAIWRWRYKRQIKKEEFHYGWQDDRERMGKCDGWDGARVFVASSTSGLSASTKPHEKEAIWKPFGEWVQMRRKERALQEARVGEGEGISDK